MDAGETSGSCRCHQQTQKTGPAVGGLLGKCNHIPRHARRHRPGWLLGETLRNRTGRRPRSTVEKLKSLSGASLGLNTFPS